MSLPVNLSPDEASPEWMNKADNAWQLTVATLVGLQSMPGLVILYGSMVKGKWAVNSALMAFYAFAAVLVCWVGWGYRMSFGERLAPFLGKPGVALDEGYLLGQVFLELLPTATMVFFQGVFAAITLILVAGALLGRMNFRDWMLFVPLRLTCSYTVAAYSIWVSDGWCYSFLSGRPSVVSAVKGMITGLVCITPAAGLVQGWAAILMGAVSESVPWYTMTVLHDRVGVLRRVNDPMSVLHTHAVTGSVGGVLTGFFAVPKLCRLFYMAPDWEKYTGLAYSLQDKSENARFRQIGLVVPLRLSEGEMRAGDKAVHGERGFVLAADGARFEITKNNSFYDMEDEPPSIESRSLGDVWMV